MIERIGRIYRLHGLLAGSRVGRSIDELSEALGVSRSSVYRDLAFLRDALLAPVEVDPETQRHRYAAGERFELPGLWLTPEQVHALVLVQQVLGADEGPVARLLGPLDTRLKRLLGARAERLARLRVLPSHSRRLDGQVFHQVVDAVLAPHAIRFGYRARSTDERTEREVHPQRLTYYKDNWYLDAYDQARRALRSFALDRISAVRASERPFHAVEAEALADFSTRGYGIFSAPTREIATIRFSAHAARWVADERWHPRQEGKLLPDGRYELKLPFGHPRELLMDVLRYGADAEIVAPVALRQQMHAMLQLTLSQYE